MERTKLPSNRKDKVALLKGIAAGTRSIKELLPNQFIVTMWVDCKEDPNYMVCYAGKNKGERITKEQYQRYQELSKHDPNVWNVSLDF